VRFGWEREITASGLPKTARLVALVLGTYMNAEGTCYPSVKTIAREAGIAESTARAALDELDRWGYIVRTRGGGRSNTTLYTAALRGETLRQSAAFPAAKPANQRRNSPASARKGADPRPRTLRSTPEQLVRGSNAAATSYRIDEECFECGSRPVRDYGERGLLCDDCAERRPPSAPPAADQLQTTAPGGSA
jgi:DNA-binding transcriptional MocR family regulator